MSNCSRAPVRVSNCILVDTVVSSSSIYPSFVVIIGWSREAYTKMTCGGRSTYVVESLDSVDVRASSDGFSLVHGASSRSLSASTDS